jgi:hypothetical protein
MSETKKEKVNPAERIALNITPDKKLFCNICNLELLKDYSCGKCGIYYLPEQARHQIVIKGMDGKEPGPNTTTIPVASVDTPTTTSKKPKMTALFESMERSGFKFTSYTESNT